jgi:hypothetical protein
VPFKTILPYLMGHKGWMIAGINLVGNIILLVPIGFLVPFIWPTITWKKAIIIAVASGLAIELMQTILRVGIFDIDDVILNGIGVLIGYGAFVILEKWLRLRKYKSIVIAVIIIMVVIAGAFYAIYPKDPLVVPEVAASGISDGKGDTIQGVDPCNGTGGNGRIVSKGVLRIDIKRNDSIVQAIQLTERTVIRNSLGPASESDLKIGDRVTVVVDASETAKAVVVCNVPTQGTQQGK